MPSSTVSTEAVTPSTSSDLDVRRLVAQTDVADGVVVALTSSTIAWFDGRSLRRLARTRLSLPTTSP